MQGKAAIPFWSIDAFLYFIMPRDYASNWSSELISRVSSFIDAYVLYDRVVLPERYKTIKELKALDPDENIFEYIPSNSLSHSDELINGISLDLSLNMDNLESLMQEDYKWFSQHDGNVTEEDYYSFFQPHGISMTYLRLWQLGLVSEIAEKTDSSIILPLSLQGLERNDSKRNIPFHVTKLSELGDHFQNAIKSVTASVGDIFVDHLTKTPPLFTLFLDQVLTREHATDTLKKLRGNYSSLRALSNEYKASVEAADSIRDKKNIVDDWNLSWEKLLKGDFNKPQFLRKKISSADVSKSLIKPESAGISTLVQAYLDYREERRSYKRFRVYSELYNELDGIAGSRKSLESKFSIRLVNELHL